MDQAAFSHTPAATPLYPDTPAHSLLDTPATARFTPSATPASSYARPTVSSSVKWTPGAYATPAATPAPGTPHTVR